MNITPPLVNITNIVTNATPNTTTLHTLVAANAAFRYRIVHCAISIFGQNTTAQGAVEFTEGINGPRFCRFDFIGVGNYLGPTYEFPGYRLPANTAIAGNVFSSAATQTFILTVVYRNT